MQDLKERVRDFEMTMHRQRAQDYQRQLEYQQHMGRTSSACAVMGYPQSTSGYHGNLISPTTTSPRSAGFGAYHSAAQNAFQVPMTQAIGNQLPSWQEPHRPTLQAASHSPMRQPHFGQVVEVFPVTPTRPSVEPSIPPSTQALQVVPPTMRATGGPSTEAYMQHSTLRQRSTPQQQLHQPANSRTCSPMRQTGY